MSEKLPSERDPEEQAEKRGGFRAGYEALSPLERSGYLDTVKHLGRIGFLSPEDTDKRLSGDRRREIREKLATTKQPTITREQAVAENERAWNDMLGRREEVEEPDVDEQGQLQFPTE